MDYALSAIVTPYVTEYIRKKTVHNNPLLTELEEYASLNKVPIAEPETARLCRSLQSLYGRKKFLR